MPGFFRRTPSPRDLYRAYCDGLPGSIPDPARGEKLLERGTVLPCSGPETASIKDLHKQHKRVLLFQATRQVDPPANGRPGAYADESQVTGDCASHGGRGAIDTTRAVEIVTLGSGEQWVARGATEYIYAGRGHRGQGMSPQTVTQILADGQLLRRDYRDQGGPDLRVYNARIGMDRGGAGIPQTWRSIAKTQLRAGKWLAPQTVEESLDCLAAGFGAHAGSQFGSSPQTGADGLNLRTTSWNHSMCECGYDLSAELWRVPVVFIANSWGAWNKPNPVWMANQDALGPWIPGMLVVPLDVYAKNIVAARSLYHMAHVEGDAIKPLPLTSSGIAGWGLAA